MENLNKKIYTKENPIKKVNEKLYPIEKEDREIINLEKTCDLLSIALKVELVITMVVVTIAFIFNGFTFSPEEKIEHKSVSISTEK